MEEDTSEKLAEDAGSITGSALDCSKKGTLKGPALLEHLRSVCLNRIEMSKKSASMAKETRGLRDEEINIQSENEKKGIDTGDPVEAHNQNKEKPNVICPETKEIVMQTEIKELQENRTQAESTQFDKMDVGTENVTTVTKAEKQGILNETSTTISNEDIQGYQTKSQAPESSADLRDGQSNPESFRVVLAGSVEEIHTVEINKRRKVQLEAPDTGPRFYNIQGNFVTPPLIPARLPEAFESLPVFGQTGSTTEPNKAKMLWEFVGGDMEEEEFDKLGMYCSTENLRTGLELSMPSKEPRTGGSALTDIKERLNSTAGAGGGGGGGGNTGPGGEGGEGGPGGHLHSVRRHRQLMARDKNNMYIKKLKYRGVRFLNVEPNTAEESDKLEPLLVPGKDLLFRVRIYRPFLYSPRERKRTGCGRHPLFVCDLQLLGRQSLRQLRDRIACINDQGLRIDLSERPDYEPLSNCKELFPSGFLFINNVFYNDKRPGCSDYSAPIREWAQRRDIGKFAAEDMGSVRLDQLTVRLGYPEVYVHQGNCEHLFTFAEVRLIGLGDPTRPSLYPNHRCAASYNSVYCTTCAEYPANWVVTNSPRVPFDPALFCDSCFRLYMYSNGKKCGDFKAVRFKGNELETLTS